MKISNNGDQYSDEEAQRRFEAAIRGARIAGAKPLKSLTSKGVPAQRKKKPQARDVDTA
ncbi:MAG: hypothetical protein ACLPKB_28940 [Xanthobacteraceae bacterium]